MKDKISLPEDKKLAATIINNENEKDKNRIALGYLGKFWGNSESIPNNIAALAAFLLLLTGIIYTFCTSKLKEDEVGISIKDFWSILAPLITLSIGYLFGERSKK